MPVYRCDAVAGEKSVCQTSTPGNPIFACSERWRVKAVLTERAPGLLWHPVQGAYPSAAPDVGRRISSDWRPLVARRSDPHAEAFAAAPRKQVFYTQWVSPPRSQLCRLRIDVHVCLCLAHCLKNLCIWQRSAVHRSGWLWAASRQATSRRCSGPGVWLHRACADLCGLGEDWSGAAAVTLPAAAAQQALPLTTRGPPAVRCPGPGQILIVLPQTTYKSLGTPTLFAMVWRGSMHAFMSMRLDTWKYPPRDTTFLMQGVRAVCE